MKIIAAVCLNGSLYQRIVYFDYLVGPLLQGFFLRDIKEPWERRRQELLYRRQIIRYSA